MSNLIGDPDREKAYMLRPAFKINDTEQLSLQWNLNVVGERSLSCKYCLHEGSIVQDQIDGTLSALFSLRSYIVRSLYSVLVEKSTAVSSCRFESFSDVTPPTDKISNQIGLFAITN